MNLRAPYCRIRSSHFQSIPCFIFTRFLTAFTKNVYLLRHKHRVYNCFKTDDLKIYPSSLFGASPPNLANKALHCVGCKKDISDEEICQRQSAVKNLECSPKFLALQKNWIQFWGLNKTTSLTTSVCLLLVFLNLMLKVWLYRISFFLVWLKLIGISWEPDYV